MLTLKNCCFDSELFGTRFECDRLTCKGKHYPEFQLYRRNVSGCLFYILNEKQLHEYWGCCVRDQEEFCPEKCGKCTVCKFLVSTYNELVRNYFFNNSIDYKPILWRVFTRYLDKKIIN